MAFFKSSYSAGYGFHPPPGSQIHFNPMIGRNFGAPSHPGPPPKVTPVTTVFVGNISEKCSNEFMKQMLQECGRVGNWKRIQGSNGKYQAFGFCDYENPEGTLRALRVLNDFHLGDKKLVVKAEDKVRAELRAWAIQKRKEENKTELKLKEDELPADDDDLKIDEDVRLKILHWIEIDHPQLLIIAEDGELSDKEGKDKKKDKCKDGEDMKDGELGKKRKRSRSRSNSRSRRRNVSKSPKRRRKHSSSRSHSSGSSRSSSASSKSSRSRSDSPKKRKRRDRSYSRASENSEEAEERRKLKKVIREKERAYMRRLKNWEKREKDMSKKYERYERKNKDRKVNILKEAKRMRHFLEDYDDEKDDAKYYKASELFKRRREFEREREADQKDRLKEQAEIEELKKQILDENKEKQLEQVKIEEEAKLRHQKKEDEALRRLRGDSGSPNPHQPLGQQSAEDSSSSSGESDDEPETKTASPKEPMPANGSLQPTNGEVKSDVQPPTAGAPLNQGQWKSVAQSSSNANANVKATAPSALSFAPKKDLSQRLNGVFGVEEDDDENQRVKMKPFEITREERMATMSEEERKRLQKDLVNRIPTAKDDLFAFQLDWKFVDDSILNSRVRPWVGKKITEYLGEEEKALVDFIVDKILTKTPPATILNDVAMILDNDAELFVMKMWRLLVFESEAKRLGIPTKLR